MVDSNGEMKREMQTRNQCMYYTRSRRETGRMLERNTYRYNSTFQLYVEAGP